MITPHGKHERLGNQVGVPALYLKREDLHPYGSHKGRSIPFMINKYRNDGSTRFAISSSGNAALAAIYHIQNINRDFPEDELSLSIFIGKNVNPEKEDLLRRNITDPKRITITKTDRPKQALMIAEKDGCTSLRQSTNDDALTGYFDLARELTEIPHLSAVFIGTSSGTTAEALLRAFSKISPHTHVHIVQTTGCSPIASMFDNYSSTDDASIADAIVDSVALRKEKLAALLKSGKGSGWIVTNEEILEAQTLTRETTGILISPNGALPLAGLRKARKHGYHFPGAVALIIGGK